MPFMSQECLTQSIIDDGLFSKDAHKRHQTRVRKHWNAEETPSMTQRKPNITHNGRSHHRK